MTAAGLMGQPTYIGPNQINVATVMRGDITVADLLWPTGSLSERDR
jgi:hypothetical protein